MKPIDADMAIDAIQKDRETSWKDLENDDAEYRNGCDDGYAYSMQIISELPSADAVEVVRCKDCKHYTEPNIEYCELYGAMILWSKDDFCSRGEGRTKR